MKNNQTNGAVMLKAIAIVIFLTQLVACGGAVPSSPTPSGSITLSAASISFGDQAVNSASSPQTMTITNTGNASVTPDSITIDNQAFTWTGLSLPVDIAAGGSAQFSVTFNPGAEGFTQGTLTVSSTASGSSATATLSGTGVASAVSLNPVSLDFGTRTVNTTSMAQPVTLTNTGSADLQISTVSVSPNQFAFSGPAVPTTVAPGNSVTYDITFTPDTASSFSGSLTFTTDASNPNSTVSLSGTGALDTTVLDVSPTSIDFDTQEVDTTSAPRSVVATNSGAATLTISDVSTAAPFAVSGFSGSAMLTPNSSLTLDVTFTPNAENTFNGALTITSDAPSSPNTVSLTGTGTVAGSCLAGPPYTSPSDTIAQAEPALPTIGGANSKITDPTFGNQIVRATDDAVASALGFAGNEFGTTASAEVNRWSSDSSHVAILMTGNNRSFVFTFDPDCSSSNYMDANLDNNFFSGGSEVPWPDIQFNAREPNIAYGNDIGWLIQRCEHDHTNGGCPSQTLFDIQANPNIPTLLNPAGSSFSTTFDTDANIAFAVTGDQRDPQGQDRWDTVVVCVRGLGCRWYDTENREMGGDFGPACSNCGRSPGITIHNVRIAHRQDGDIDNLYVFIAPGSAGASTLVWRVNSTEVQECSVRCFGHRIAGDTFSINNANDGDARMMVIRNHSTYNVIADLITSFPQPGLGGGMDMHPALPVDESFVFQAGYAPGASCVPTTAWQCEVYGMATDGSEFVHRFAHHRAVDSGFWSLPKGNIDPTGRFYMFTSNWDDTLGGRWDAFIVELK